MDESYQNVSLRLTQVLDWIGASEEMRGIYREDAIVREILGTATGNCIFPEYTAYIFGSYFEGTTTLGLHSDFDTLICSRILVVERICDAPQYGVALLIVTDDTTKPGYVKLQLVCNRVAQTIHHRETSFIEATDHLGKICFKHVPHVLYRSNLRFLAEINGPAMSSKSTNNAYVLDTVPSLRCQFIPSFVSSWISRTRMRNWPHPEQIDQMKDYGCFLVGVNHPTNRNCPIEWRLSFSLQERVLMSSLNSTQHKCYILLKMIKKDIIHKQVPESISSYHLKTCLFYAIENTPCTLWTTHTLLECLLLCMRLLLHWVKEQYCPNYFVSNENMFDKLGHTTLRRVQTVIEGMVDNWCIFLRSITCDDIGNVLFDELLGRGAGIIQIRNESVSIQIAMKYINLWNNSKCVTKDAISLRRCKSSSDVLSLLHELKCALTQTNAVREYTAEQTGMVNNYINPHISLHIAQCLASVMLTIRDEGCLGNEFMDHIAACKDYDVLSSYLVGASYCFQSGKFDTCEKFLLECETVLMKQVVSCCSCFIFQYNYEGALKALSQLLQRQAMTFKQFMRTCITGCITFLPFEANLVTQALHLEMYRSVNTSPLPLHIKFSFDSIVVDSKVYLYFLQYVLYSKINKPVNKQDAIDNLVCVINTDRTIGHRETAYNLLGWIHSQENRKHEALKCFLKSWKILPNHNAAKWHVLLLIYHINTHINESNYYRITAR